MVSDSNDIAEYFETIASIGSLSGVSNEPHRLRNEASIMNDEITKFALDNYKVYLNHSEASNELSKTISYLSSLLSEVVYSLPNLNHQVTNISQVEGKQILLDYVRNRTTLRHHSSLLELLEIPQLMDTCVRNELYDEALSLIGLSSTLERRHALDSTSNSSNSIINGIVSDIRNHGVNMKENLFNILKTDIELPTCLKVITHLRRYESHLRSSKIDHTSVNDSERNLRIRFLSCKTEWLASNIKSLGPSPSSDPFNYISKLIDKCRVIWYSIITQYQAIFDNEKDIEVDVALHSFLIDATGLFINLFKTNLEIILDGNNISRVCDQTIYFGVYLARVGLDLRPLMNPIITNHVLNLMNKSFTEASGEFNNDLLSSNSSQWSLIFGDKTSILLNTKDLSTFEPPESLMDVPIIAKWINKILSSFNELRVCASYEMRGKLYDYLLNSSETVISSLSNFKLMFLNEIGEDNTMLLSRFEYVCNLFYTIALNYLNKAFYAIFGEENENFSLKIDFVLLKNKMEEFKLIKN